MKATKPKPGMKRLPVVFMLLMPVSFLAGCSQDFARVDDVYVPVLVEDRFPIEVVERPVKLNVSARSGAITSKDASHLAGFANVAAQTGSSPVRVSYPASSARAREVSRQVVGVLVAEGVPRSRIHTSSYKGKSDLVALSFVRNIAATKPCGDWSKNLGVDPRNEPAPDFGCSYQNNVAAMVANPEDFERPRSMGPAYAAGQMTAMERYNSGEWTTPPIDPDQISDIGN